MAKYIIILYKFKETVLPMRKEWVQLHKKCAAINYITLYLKNVNKYND